MESTADSRPIFYLDDLRVGQKFETGTYRMDEARMKAFAAEFDPQPFHLDEAAAKVSVFHGLAASGWHTAAATMRMIVDGKFKLAGGSIGLGGEIAWPTATRPGDTLRVHTEVVEIVPSKSKPNQAIVKIRNVTVNQKGQDVQIFTAKLMVFKRPATTE
ncbi:MAG: MaoC family dehydratase [Candidatus Acidiferrales bacterium]